MSWISCEINKIKFTTLLPFIHYARAGSYSTCTGVSSDSTSETKQGPENGMDSLNAGALYRRVYMNVSIGGAGGGGLSLICFPLL